jgi:cyclophilin family peptidyl-prolyl cis-trans isomerase
MRSRSFHPARRSSGAIVTAWLPWFAAALLAAMARAQPPNRLTPEGRAQLIARMRVAEDRRGRGPEGLGPLLDGLRTGDADVRQLAVQGLGRQEDPELLRYLVPLSSDRNPLTRAVAANAIAQSLQRLSSSDAGGRTPRQHALVDSAFQALHRSAMAESNAAALAALARAMGRLPYDEPLQARAADAALLEIAGRRASVAATGPAASDVARMEGVAHGLASLARARRTLGDLSSSAESWLLRTAGAGYSGSAGIGVSASTAALRRLVWLALAAAGVRDAPAVLDAVRDPDAQVRRLALVYLPNASDTAVRRDALAAARGDTSFQVRLEWVRVYRQFFAAGDCGPLLAATGDPNPHVQLAAIDALGAPCPDRAAVNARLRQVIDAGPAGVSARRAGRVSWHARAHALLALARSDAPSATELLGRDATHPVWQVRMYVARGAAAIRDTGMLARLAADSAGNVREAALDGLSTIAGHAADATYVTALTSRDYQVVLAGARALKGAKVRDSAATAVLDALDRLTAQSRENSRDPRLELVARLGESDDPRVVTRLAPYVRDFDGAVAARAAEILNRRGGGQFVATPQPLTVTPDSLGWLSANRPARLRVTMAAASGGGSFTLDLDMRNTPATVARVLALTKRGYYNGLTWHRVVPNFVLQGGSPGATEYIGDGPFMRDELTDRSHLRGTLGISTRGRDTGDAQLFINLVDNYRLDHDYTVFANIVTGMAVVDGILEGDVIARVERIP